MASASKISIDLNLCHESARENMATPDGKYLIQAFLGKGSEGRIYTAQAAPTAPLTFPLAEVVVKVINMPRDASIQREILEHQKKLIGLDCQNIVNVLDVQIRENSCYIIMVISS